MFKPFKVQEFPEVGWNMGYFGASGEPLPEEDVFKTYFTVTEVDRNTGCIYLRAKDNEAAREVLAFETKDKHGQPMKALVFAWIEKRGEFAVNVEWDAWRDCWRLNDDLLEPET